MTGYYGKLKEPDRGKEKDGEVEATESENMNRENMFTLLKANLLQTILFML